MNHLQPTREMLASGCPYQKEVGDVVQLGKNAGQEYRVVAIDGDEAWIRSTNPTGYMGGFVVTLDRLRWIRAAVQPADLALAA